MKNIFLIMAMVAITSIQAFAATQPFYRDLKLPTQVMLEHQNIASPAAAGTTDMLNGVAGPTSAAAATITSFTKQPDFARNLVMTPGGTTAHLNACAVVISGLDMNGVAISETFSFTSTQSTATTGAKAFASVSSVAFPAGCEASTYDVTWSLGFGAKLGLKRCMDFAGAYAFSVFNGAYETTRGTAVANATSLANNTFTPNGSADGSKDVDVYFIQNYRCLPNN